MKYVLLAVLWILFCVLHSGLISIRFSAFAKRALGSGYRFYRLFYNIFAVVTLIPVVLYSHSLKQQPFFVWNGHLFIGKWILIITGVSLFILGARHYSMSVFMGIAQIREKSGHALISRSDTIDSTGILGLVRHPLYAGIFPLLWAQNLDTSTLITNIVLSVYVIVGTFLEERKLVIEFGEEYRNYRKRVSMFFPVKWIYLRCKRLFF
ncbi:MAG TPA: hypothetical protein VF857_11120 [Spirochaetota bacterium]